MKNLKETRNADDRAVVFVEEVLSNSLNISEALGISEPSAACIRLVAGATALGAFGSEYEVPCSFWTDIVDDWRKTFESATSEKRFPDSFFPAVVLGNMLSTGALHGFGDLPEHCETGFGSFARNCSETVFADTVSLTRRIFSGVSEREILSAPGGVGLKKLWVLSWGAPETPEFWIPEKAFEMDGETIVSENASTPLRALAASFLESEDEETARLGESLEAVSIFLSGRFDIVRFDRSGDSFSASASDRDVPSVFEQTTIERPKGERCVGRSCGMSPTVETKGFRKRLDELGANSPFGKQVFRAFLVESLAALSVPTDFADRDPEGRVETEEALPLASDCISRYLGKRISGIVSASENPFGGFARFIGVPCAPTLASYRDSDGVPLVLRISELARSADTGLSGRRPRAFADGVAVTKLLSDDGFTRVLAETASDKNSCGKAERVADFLLGAFDGLTSLDLENGPIHTMTRDDGRKRRKDALENALREYVSGVGRFFTEIRKLSPSAASDIRKKVEKRLSEYRATFPSLDERAAEMRHTSPHDTAETTEVWIRSVHKRRTVEVPDIDGNAGSGAPVL